MRRCTISDYNTGASLSYWYLCCCRRRSYCSRSPKTSHRCSGFGLSLHIDAHLPLSHGSEQLRVCLPQHWDCRSRRFSSGLEIRKRTRRRARERSDTTAPPETSTFGQGKDHNEYRVDEQHVKKTLFECSFGKRVPRFTGVHNIVNS